MSELIVDQIKSIGETIKTLRNQNITHEDHGKASGFHAAQEAKDATFKYLNDLHSKIKDYFTNLNSTILLQNLKEIERILEKIRQESNDINRIVDEGVSRKEFPEERQQKINLFLAIEREIKVNLHTLELDLKLEQIKSLLAETDVVEGLKNDLQTALNTFNEKVADSDKILENLKTGVMEQGVKAGVETFGKLRANHQERERNWFIGVCVSGAVSLFAFGCVVFCDLGTVPSETPQAISLLMKRLIAISAPLIFLKLTMTKYNVERNLRIIYDHRETVLNQYTNFETAIGDDVEAKNAFRLEIAKYIFSDPQTGYLTGKDASEINVNPIINMAEKMAKG